MTDDTDDRTCDHCGTRIRALTCRMNTTAFGIACINCRHQLRDDPDAEITPCDPAPVDPADRRSYYGPGENGDDGEAAAVSQLVAALRAVVDG